MKKRFSTILLIILLLCLVSCVDRAANYPIIAIQYSEDIISKNPVVNIQTLGYSFGEGNIFEYDNETTIEKLSDGRNLYTSEYIIDNNSEYFIINPWKLISWTLSPRYDLHQKSYIISLDNGTRWDFKKGQIVLSVHNGYAYYVEGVKIYKVNLQDEKDKEVVYTFPFKKTLPLNPIVNIEGVETELYSTYTFVINEDGILIQSKIRDSDDVYTFADIKY